MLHMTTRWKIGLGIFKRTWKCSPVAKLSIPSTFSFSTLQEMLCGRFEAFATLRL